MFCCLVFLTSLRCWEIAVDLVTSSSDAQIGWQELFSHKLLYNKEQSTIAIYFTTYQNSRRIIILRNMNWHLQAWKTGTCVLILVKVLEALKVIGGKDTDQLWSERSRTARQGYWLKPNIASVMLSIVWTWSVLHQPANKLAFLVALLCSGSVWVCVSTAMDMPFLSLRADLTYDWW